MINWENLGNWIDENRKAFWLNGFAKGFGVGFILGVMTIVLAELL